MNIYIDEGQKLDCKMLEKMQEAGDFLMGEEGIDTDRAEISLTLVEPEEIKSLNAEYRNVDSVTDVLSFPQYDDIRNPDNPQAICLGDVVICDDTARRQAEEYGHSYERELVYLFVHSVLHLLGYDHMDEEERREMRTREENVMRRVGLSRD